MSKKENLKLPSDILEPAIIVHSLEDVSFFLKIKPYLFVKDVKSKKSYFTETKLQKIFNIICIWYNKRFEFPNEKEMYLLLDKIEKDEEVKLLTKSLIKEIFDDNFEKINPNYIEEETKKFIQENQIYEAMLSSQIDIENGNFSAIADKMQKAITVNFDKDLGISIRDIQTGLSQINDLDDNTKTVASGFASLDAENALDYGFHAGEVTIFAGIPGIGKSAILGNLAINAFLENKNVLLYTFEVSTSRLLTRYYANLIDMTKSEIIKDNAKTKNELNSVLNITTGDIILKQYPANVISSNDLMAHINDLMLYKNWKPDIIFTDYLLLHSTNDKLLSADNSYKYYKTVTEEFRNLCLNLDVPGVSAAQINRQGMDDKGGSKALTTSKDVSESRGIIDTCDNFITINQTSNDRKLGKIMFYFDKCRNGQKGQRIKMDIDYNHMRFTEV